MCKVLVAPMAIATPALARRLVAAPKITHNGHRAAAAVSSRSVRARGSVANIPCQAPELMKRFSGWDARSRAEQELETRFDRIEQFVTAITDRGRTLAQSPAPEQRLTLFH